MSSLKKAYRHTEEQSTKYIQKTHAVKKPQISCYPYLFSSLLPWCMQCITTITLSAFVLFALLLTFCGFKKGKSSSKAFYFVYMCVSSWSIQGQSLNITDFMQHYLKLCLCVDFFVFRSGMQRNNPSPFCFHHRHVVSAYVCTVCYIWPPMRGQ